MECYCLATLLDVRDGSPAEPDRGGEPMLGELLSPPGLGDAFTDKPVEHILGERHATKP